MRLSNLRRELAAFVTFSCVIAAGATVFGQTSTSLPSSRDLSRYGLTRAWWNQATMDPSRDQIRHLTGDEDNIYVQSRSGIVTAFDAESGRRLWSLLVGSDNQQALPASSNSGILLIAVGLKVHAVNKFTGEVLWELELPHHPSTAPAMDDDRVYLGMVDGSSFAYDLRKIRELWEENRLPRWSNYAFVWRYKAPQQISSPPVPDGRSVTFASMNGSVYSVGASERKLFFQFETAGRTRIVTPLGRGRDSIFVTSEDARMFCLNKENGVRRWAFTAGVPIRQQPRVVEGSVYVCPQDDGMYCLNVNSGLTNWHQARASSFLASTTDYLIASDSLDNVLLLSHDDGAIVGVLPLRGLNVRLHNERTDRCYLASDDGLIVCLREKGQEFPLYHMFPDRRPLLPEFAPDEAEPPAPEPDPTEPN